MTTRLKVIAIVCVLLVCSACVGGPATVAPRVTADYEPGALSKGSACGVLLLAFIPIMVNSRTQRAYDQATTGKANGLADTRISQHYFFFPGGLLLCTDIEGRLLR